MAPQDENLYGSQKTPRPELQDGAARSELLSDQRVGLLQSRPSVSHQGRTHVGRCGEPGSYQRPTEYFPVPRMEYVPVLGREHWQCGEQQTGRDPNK